jgi:hypothetical protein
VPTVAPNATLSCCASWAIATPVTIFVTEPRMKIVSGPFGIRRSLSANPWDRASTVLSR